MKAKAYITIGQPAFLQKVLQYNLNVVDAYDSRYKTHISVFLPKLKQRYIQPVVMFSINNGRSACLMRVESPLTLADILEKLAGILRSDLWLDAWERLDYCSKSIIVGEQSTIDLDAAIYDTHD